MFSFDTKREPEKCIALRGVTFCLFSACKDAPLGQRQGGVFRLPPPYLWPPPTPQRNNCDRRQRRKQRAVVGAAASKTRVPPKARSGCWVPQPVAKGYANADAFLADSDAYFEHLAKQDLVMQAIAEQLDITPTQEQIDSANSSYADTYGAQRSMLNALQLAVLDKVEESAVLS